MELELRHLRSFVGVVDAGTFTDAGIDLGISQTAVSRNVAALESVLGRRLLHRTTRSVELAPAGERVLRHARRVLAVVDDLREEAAAGTDTIRIGYAWSALGEHTQEFQRRWAAALPRHELRLIRSNTPTAGLAEGLSDLAILRRGSPAADVESALIGTEKRYCALSVDDPLAAKRTVTLAQVATAPLALDDRTGSTRLDLWPEHDRPRITVPTTDVDDWLTVISSGSARGVTAESTVSQYRRQGLAYRVVRDAPPVPVHAAWIRSDPPPVLGDVIGLLQGLYRTSD
ncbi:MULTISPECIES: LysR family transcriptional regulator [unclassified Rathayibacter]|uniref:LysR family transcriptional regulator n=1 Tax=unclassified Rathayibacter TaxID=2609250 RepID=UPI000CE92834|nr:MULTISPECIES: LysR family transcriptional regulator [unclassified Rathayibacter]PPF27885.1 LysR family transcriptional regulator [Rathayibacter sp. AY1F2]PPF33435.1 LysR family transcriptional regulator [Rathayibacter sp. AY1A3]PPH45823.1 LysR family transcriptional regulator [Rathayibacter sp. AY1F7]PPH98735.1 LysR family transcriptional regulator [Rathayibacter sp. AY1D1]